MNIKSSILCLAVISLTACGGGGGGASSGAGPYVPVATSNPTPTPSPSPSPLAMPAGASAVAAKQIQTATGGAVTVPGGGITLSANVLATDAVVQIASVPQPQESSPSTNVTPIGPMIRMAVYSSGSPTQAQRRQVKDVSSNMATFTMAVAGNAATGLVSMTSKRRAADASPQASAFILPIARIYSESDPKKYIDVSPKFSFDPATSVITASLNGNAAQFAVGAIIEFFLVQKTGGNPACGLQGRFTPGLRYYDPITHAWLTGAPPGGTRLHALLVLHGIMSCVEDTFGTGLVDRFRADGAYDFIIGYDYDWFENPSTIAPQIAAEVNAFNLAKIDIVAHSYGTVNAMALVPLLDVKSIDNVVLYDGPLNGSFLNDQAVFQTLLADGQALGHAVTATITTSLIANATKIYALTNNTQLDAIKAAFVNSRKVAHVLKVTGLNPLPLGDSTFAALYTKMTGKDPGPNDGIVSVDSAEDLTVHGAQPKATGGSTDTINELTDAKAFPGTHTSILQDEASRIVTEKFIAPRLSFEFNNADAYSGYYPNGGAAIVMKGKGTRAHFYPRDAYSTVTFGVDSLVGTNLDYAPPSVPVVNGTSATPITFTVNASPAAPIAMLDKPANPTATAMFFYLDANNNKRLYRSDFFVLPDCVSVDCSNTQSIFRSPLFVNSDRRSSASQSTGFVVSSEPLVKK